MSPINGASHHRALTLPALYAGDIEDTPEDGEAKWLRGLRPVVLGCPAAPMSHKLKSRNTWHIVTPSSGSATKISFDMSGVPFHPFAKARS